MADLHRLTGLPVRDRYNDCARCLWSRFHGGLVMCDVADRLTVYGDGTCTLYARPGRRGRCKGTAHLHVPHQGCGWWLPIRPLPWEWCRPSLAWDDDAHLDAYAYRKPGPLCSRLGLAECDATYPPQWWPYVCGPRHTLACSTEVTP